MYVLWQLNLGDGSAARAVGGARGVSWYDKCLIICSVELITSHIFCRFAFRRFPSLPISSRRSESHINNCFKFVFNGFHYLSPNKGESGPPELGLSGVLTLTLVQRFSTCPRNGNYPEFKEPSCEILGSPRNHWRSSFTLFVLPKVQSLHSSMILESFLCKFFNSWF